jgi:hypothetical protein
VGNYTRPHQSHVGSASRLRPFKLTRDIPLLTTFEELAHNFGYEFHSMNGENAEWWAACRFGRISLGVSLAEIGRCGLPFLSSCEGNPLVDFNSKQHSTGEITMHPLRKLRESGKPTPAQISELLAENFLFNSPILVRPIQGREVLAAIFAQSSATRGSGTYTTEVKLDERTTFLRWVGTMDGHKFESLEVIVDNEQGLIVERTIALRPYPALKLFRDATYAALKDKLPPDVWDYPTP